MFVGKNKIQIGRCFQALFLSIFALIMVQWVFHRLGQSNETFEEIPISMEALKITQELVKKRQEKTSFDVRKKVKNRKALDLAKNNQVP